MAARFAAEKGCRVLLDALRGTENTDRARLFAGQYQNVMGAGVC